MIHPTKYLKTVLLAFVCVSLFTTCKKYPEDGKITLQTAKKRLKSHTWYFTKLTIDGNDSTIVHLHKFAPNSNDSRFFSFYIDEGINLKTNYGTAILADYNSGLSFKMGFENKKNDLDIYPVFYSTNTNHSMFWVAGPRRNWDIKELTKTDLIIETNYDGAIVRFQFKN